MSFITCPCRLIRPGDRGEIRGRNEDFVGNRHERVELDEGDVSHRTRRRGLPCGECVVHVHESRAASSKPSPNLSELVGVIAGRAEHVTEQRADCGVQTARIEREPVDTALRQFSGRSNISAQSIDTLSGKSCEIHRPPAL